MTRRNRENAAIDRIIRRGELDDGLPVGIVVRDYGRDATRLAKGTGSLARNAAARAAMQIGSSRSFNGDPDAPPPAKPKGRLLGNKGNKGADASLGDLGDGKTGRWSGFGRATNSFLFGKKPEDLHTKNMRDAGL